jgi:predicted permease
MSSLRYAVRSLLKTPGFTAIALLTLALGIGVNTAMFSMTNTLLLQPAPYPGADRLVRVFRTSPQSRTWPHSAPDLQDERAQSHVFDSLAAFQWWSFSLSEPGSPAERVRGLVASAEFFSTLGVQPALGRAFTADEQQPGRDQVVVLTHVLWQRRFAGNPAIIGRAIRIDGANLTVIGVLPATFAYPLLWGQLEAVRPLVLAADWQHSRGNHWLGAIARLKPGIPLPEAQAELDGIAARLSQQYPDTNAGTGLRLVPLHASAMDDTGRNVTWLTLGLAGFVLLIACANLANLQLARSAGRARDFAIRTALGASRARLMRQLLAESTVLALTGGALGLVIAVWVNDLLGHRLNLGGDTGVPIALDWSVLGFALVASLAAALLSGTVPAWLAGRTDVNHALKQQGRGATGDRSRHRFRHTLIAAEIAFALVLLTGAGFFLRGLQRFTDRDPGWQTAGLLTGTLTLPDTLAGDRYVKPEARLAFYDRLVQRLAALPGVEHAALASSVPISSYNSSRNFSVEGRADPAAGQEPLADHVFVTPGFFTTLGLQLVAGREFPASIRADSPRVAVINETMARQFWPNESAVGKRIGGTDPKEREWVEVVGVVRDVGFVASLGLPDTRFQVYRPLVQEPWGYLTIALRAAAPNSLAEPLRRAVAELDADLPVADIRTIGQAVDRAQHNVHVANQLLAGFALLGLGLAAVGLYGVISSLVVQRTQEFGIRVALGAQSGQVLWLVLGQGLRLALQGSVAGILGAFVTIKLLTALFPGLPGQDYLVLGGNVVLLFSAALLACLIPARRATKVDPLVALRAE